MRLPTVTRADEIVSPVVNGSTRSLSNPNSRLTRAVTSELA